MKSLLTLILNFSFFFFITFSSKASVSSYIFTQSTTTYTPITGTNVYGNQVTDDAIFTQSLGFTFQFDGVGYTSVNIHSNGFLFFSAPWNVANYYPLSSGVDNFVISGCGEDLLSQVGGNISSITTGAPGNKVFTVQYLHYRHWTNGGIEPGERNFQIKLYEAGGKIEFIYSNFSTVNFYTAEIGLLGASLGDFKNRQTNNNWSSTSPGAFNNSNCALNPLTAPANGLMFTWKPPLQIVLTELISPPLPGCSNSANEIISYRLRNNSASPWNLSTSPLQLHCSTQGPNPVNFPPILLNTGILAGNSTTDVVVSPGNYNMSVPGVHTIRANLYSSTIPEFDDDTLTVVVSSAVSAGVAAVSNDSICIGLTDTLSLVGANGIVQWQRLSGTTWQDETGPGNQSPTYLVMPSVSGSYRAKICGNFISNVVNINVFSVPTPVTVNDSTCGVGVVNLSASGTGILNWYPVTPTLNIPIGGNAGFESPPIPNGGNVLGQMNGTPPDWNGFGSLAQYSPNLPTATFYNTLGVTPPNGAQMVGTEDGLLNAPGGSGIHRMQWGQTFEAGKKYTFSVMAGGSYMDAGGTQIVRIIAYDISSFVNNLAGTFLAENSVVYPPAGNNFVLNSVSYIATPADQGKTIQVMVGTNDADGVQTFDKAQLTVSNIVATGTSYSTSIDSTQFFEVTSQVNINSLTCYSTPAYIEAHFIDPPEIVFSPPAIDFCEGLSSTINASSLDLGLVYSWAPSNGLNTTVGPDVTSSPLASTTYTVTGINSISGCTSNQPYFVEVHPSPGNYTIDVVPSQACTGGSTQLTPVLSYTNPATIGTDSIINGPSTFPSPFSNSVTVTKHQMLYRASEILAAGFTPGPINSLSFNIKAVNACPQLVTVFIRMGLTSDTSLTYMHTGLTDVILPTWITPILGWNDFPLFTTFYWDGVSSIVIETCNQNQFATLNGNTSMYQTATSYPSTLIKKSPTPGICDITTFDDSYNQRINIRIGRDVLNTYAWTPGSELNDSLIFNPEASPSTTTMYTLTITDPSGNCTSTASASVEPNIISPLPAVTITTVLNNFLICPGDSITLGISPPCLGCTYLWSPTDGVSDTLISNPTVSPSVNTNYTLYATNSLGCTGSGSHVVGLYATPPTPTIYQQNDTLFCSLAGTYQWFLDGIQISGATQQFHKIISNGTYSVEITMGSNFCSSSSNDYLVDDVSSNELFLGAGISVFPNPFIQKSVLTFYLNKQEHIQIDVFNLIGQNVRQIWNGNLKQGRNDFNIESLSPNGDGNIYLLRISGESGQHVHKLVQIN